MKRLLCLTALVVLFGLPSMASEDALKAFPRAADGMTRHVLTLAPQSDEAGLKVELILGKSVMTDAANRYFFAGILREETIPGWGYTRYVLPAIGPMAGTLMGVDPDAPKVERFVSLGGEPFLIRYNSRLPVVVYVPEGVEVRYRIWRSDPGAARVPQG